MVQATDPAADVTASGAMPPATSPKPDELKYHDELQNKGGKRRGRAADASRCSAGPSGEAAHDAHATAAPPAGRAKPAHAVRRRITSQVDSFGSRANADRQVGQLKAKGITTAFIFEAPGPGARFKVRVGPFADRSAAEGMQARPP